VWKVNMHPCNATIAKRFLIMPYLKGDLLLTKLAIISQKVFCPNNIRFWVIKTLHHHLPPTCLKIINGLIWVDGHEHHHVEAIKYYTPHLWILNFFHGVKAPCFQHMPCAKNNWDRISTHTILPWYTQH